MTNEEEKDMEEEISDYDEVLFYIAANIHNKYGKKMLFKFLLRHCDANIRMFDIEEECGRSEKNGSTIRVIIEDGD